MTDLGSFSSVVELLAGLNFAFSTRVLRSGIRRLCGQIVNEVLAARISTLEANVEGPAFKEQVETERRRLISKGLGLAEHILHSGSANQMFLITGLYGASVLYAFGSGELSDEGKRAALFVQALLLGGANLYHHYRTSLRYVSSDGQRSSDLFWAILLPLVVVIGTLLLFKRWPVELPGLGVAPSCIAFLLGAPFLFLIAQLVAWRHILVTLTKTAATRLDESAEKPKAPKPGVPEL